MAHFIFSNELFLLKLNELNKESERISRELLIRHGIKQGCTDVVTILMISKNEWEGHTTLLDLQIECEQIYHRRIDLTKIKSVVLRDLEAASKSPHLEQARFIIILDENLLGAENYPELETILPFME